MSRAAVVLPVPGLPRKTKWRLGAFGPDSVAATLAFGLQHGDEFQDLGFDRGPADHAVQLGEGGVERTNSGAHGDRGSVAHGGGYSRLRQRRAALHGAGEAPAHEGEAEEEKPAGEGSRRGDRDGERDQGGDER